MPLDLKAILAKAGVPASQATVEPRSDLALISDAILEETLPIVQHVNEAVEPIVDSLNLRIAPETSTALIDVAQNKVMEMGVPVEAGTLAKLMAASAISDMTEAKRRLGIKDGREGTVTTICDICGKPRDDVHSKRIAHDGPCRPETALFTIPAETAQMVNSEDFDTDIKPSRNIEDIDSEHNCVHHCKKCDRFWTHGPKTACRFPDQFDFGFCQECLNGAPSMFIGNRFEDDGKGGVKLKTDAMVDVRNMERISVQNMTVEQLTHHIQFNLARIQELTVRNLESRKVRTEKEEEALLNVPEHEREAFRLALRESSKTKAKKAKSETKPKTTKATARENAAKAEADLIQTLVHAGKPLSDAKLIATWMLKTGKTQAQVEAFLND